jgi:hypothetical protein
MKRLVYKRPDGSVSIVIPVAKPVEGESESEYLGRIKARAEACDPNLAALEFVGAMAPETLPTERKFRNAWEFAGGAVRINAEKKTAQLWQEVRAERDRKLAQSDIKRKLSEDKNDGKSNAWKSYQQALRDLPQVQTDPENITWPTEP